jgi:triosephosphate isomerase
VCATDADDAAALAAFAPDLLAVEPPELIGGDVSVTAADPDIVRRSVAAARKVDRDAQLLCGAGVKTGRDVEVALELGTEGVLVASGVVSAKDPGAALAGLLEGTRARGAR